MGTHERAIFHNEDKARAYLESLRWPDGPICPHCGVINEATHLQGAKHRPGVWKCNACKKQFTVTVGTVFERSHVPIHTWLYATHLLCASKKGMSAHQLHRMLGVTYKTAWFMAHRIREAMSTDGLGGKMDGTVEADETYWGTEPGEKNPMRPSNKDKHKVVSIVQRGGDVRSFHVSDVKASTLIPLIRANVEQGTNVYTDDAPMYKRLNHRMLHPEFPHEVVCHQYAEYVCGDVHTNTVEGFFSILKRGLDGVYQHVSEEHLKRYIAEFDFRYNTRFVSDRERTDVALAGITGKRLYYKH